MRRATGITGTPGTINAIFHLLTVAPSGTKASCCAAGIDARSSAFYFAVSLT